MYLLQLGQMDVKGLLKAALCILTGLTPIAIKLEELVELYQLTRGSRKEEANIDHDVGIKHWLHHPSITTSILTDKHEDTSAIQIYTDGSKTAQGVGAGIAIYSSSTHKKSSRFKKNYRKIFRRISKL